MKDPDSRFRANEAKRPCQINGLVSACDALDVKQVDFRSTPET